MSNARATRSMAVMGLALVLLAMPLAGCISTGPSFDSYTEARDASGTTLAAQNADHAVHLKTLVPEDPQHDVDTGENNLYFLLFDRETNEPVRNAQVSMDVWKTHEDLVSSQVQTPTHSGNGVYHGVASFDKDGGWVVDLNVTLADGTELDYKIHAHAGDVDHEHEDAEHEEHDHEHEGEHEH